MTADLGTMPRFAQALAWGHPPRCCVPQRKRGPGGRCDPLLLRLDAVVCQCQRGSPATDELQWSAPALTPLLSVGIRASPSSDQAPQARAPAWRARRRAHQTAAYGAACLALRLPCRAGPIGARAPVVSDVILREGSGSTRHRDPAVAGGPRGLGGQRAAGQRCTLRGAGATAGTARIATAAGRSRTRPGRGTPRGRCPSGHPPAVPRSGPRSQTSAARPPRRVRCQTWR